MKSEQCKEEDKNYNQTVNEELKHENQESRAVRITSLLLVMTFVLGIVFFITQVFSNNDDILDSRLDFPDGKDVILTNRDFNDCSEEDDSQRDLCIFLEAGIDFEPGLYTLVITTIDDVKLEDNITINPVVGNHYFNDSYVFNLGLIMPVFGDTDPIEIENVPLDSGSNIRIRAIGGTKSYSNFMDQDNVRIEFIAQSEYKPYNEKSGSLGYYRVGKSLAPGKYKVTKKIKLKRDYKSIYAGYKVSNTKSIRSVDEYSKIYLDSTKFELVEDEVIIIFDSDISLNREAF